MRDALEYTIANHMKKCFLNWNKDTVEDAVIFDHLFELSNGEINLKNSSEELSESSSLMRPKKNYSNNKKNNKNSNNKNKNRNRKRY